MTGSYLFMFRRRKNNMVRLKKHKKMNAMRFKLEDVVEYYVKPPATIRLLLKHGREIDISCINEIELIKRLDYFDKKFNVKEI